MLYLISLGLADEKDMSIKGLETAKKCDALYVEFYTNRLETNLEKLESLIGKKVAQLNREDLEEKSKKILKEAKTADVGVFVGGDALAATTHISLVLDAKKEGVPVKVIHSSSIFTGVAETGLQLYKFGATTTLAFPQDGYHPTSCYDVIVKNKKTGLHTLVLLDIRERLMSVKDGLNTLLDLEKLKQEKIISAETKLIAASNLGSEKQKIKYGKVKDLMKEEFGMPAVIVFPGDLHFMEEEFLSLL